MSVEQNKAVIRQFFDPWNSRRPEAFGDLITPDVVRHCDATPPDVEARKRWMVRKLEAIDFRSWRIVLEPDDFALTDGKPCGEDYSKKSSSIFLM